MAKYNMSVHTKVTGSLLLKDLAHKQFEPQLKNILIKKGFDPKLSSKWFNADSEMFTTPGWQKIQNILCDSIIVTPSPKTTPTCPGTCQTKVVFDETQWDKHTTELGFQMLGFNLNVKQSHEKAKRTKISLEKTCPIKDVS